MCYHPTPKLSLHRRLCIYTFSKKPHSVWFISVLKSGDMGNVLISHLLLVIPVIPVSLYKFMSSFVTKMHAHTHTHTHTHTHARAHTHTHTHTPHTAFHCNVLMKYCNLRICSEHPKIIRLTKRSFYCWNVALKYLKILRKNSQLCLIEASQMFPLKIKTFNQLECTALKWIWRLQMQKPLSPFEIFLFNQAPMKYHWIFLKIRHSITD